MEERWRKRCLRAKAKATSFLSFIGGVLAV